MAAFNSGSVSMGPGRMGGPYVPTRALAQPGGGTAAPGGQAPAVPPGNILGPESVRATGNGPFDPAYRQDLATFAGGLFAKPGGALSFNPTALGSTWGQPTGGGTAPVFGMPSTLSQLAIGGNPFTFTPPVPSQQQQYWWQQNYGGQ